MKMKTWLEVAKELPQGHKARTDCPNCGAGTNTNAMTVYHTSKVYNGWCFACGHKPFETKGIQTLEELAEIKRINNEGLGRTQYRTIRLPDDFTSDIPLEGRLWLYKASITTRLIKKYNIGYSPRLRRAVLPVYDAQGALIWYQCRALLKGQKPKYLQPSADRANVYFHSTHSIGEATDTQNSSTVVVVEDILSAIRVGCSTDTASLLGTKLSTDNINMLSGKSRIITWMDNDKAGRQSAKDIKQALSIFTEVTNIVTERDPKLLSNTEIQEQLTRVNA